MATLVELLTINVFILDLVNMYRVLNIDSFNKKFILSLVGEYIRFILFNFMYSFMNTWAANFEMVLFIANIANVSIRWGFTSEM